MFATFFPGTDHPDMLKYNHEKHRQQITFHLTAQLQVQVLPASKDAMVKTAITVKNVL